MNPAKDRHRKHRIQVSGLDMAFVDEGEGDPIVFRHGNPASSYIWRNVIPHVVDQGRYIAPDLIGMGDSEKLPDSGPNAYRFVEYRRYLDELLQALGVQDRVTLVVQDWGSVLGFDWAYRDSSAVRGIAYMEAFAATIPSWDDMPEQGAAFLKTIRSTAGEDMVLERNFLVEDVLPHQVLRGFSEEEMAVYRRPCAQAHLDLATRSPHHRRTQGRPRHHYPLRGMARHILGSQVVHRISPRRHVRSTPRRRPVMAESDTRDDRRQPHDPGRRTRRNRNSPRVLAAESSVDPSGVGGLYPTSAGVNTSRCELRYGPAPGSSSVSFRLLIAELRTGEMCARTSVST
ncbi:haloalkane dehalogenase [Streptomyces sp. TRM72054]|uniref:haloalkane dehalogenase n=1 Tax=Streptomyces sp. TRM72054 TaxID=2870562 RepID=UPI001C8BCC9D|nr:haloalkane dehalogenase [Streptomyces sp. TRM72054]MBX9399274.1 haloalkane dehalogenase [Streptomyces sp. TRM72054]